MPLFSRTLSFVPRFVLCCVAKSSLVGYFEGVSRLLGYDVLTLGAPVECLIVILGVEKRRQNESPDGEETPSEYFSVASKHGYVKCG